MNKKNYEENSKPVSDDFINFLRQGAFIFVYDDQVNGHSAGPVIGVTCISVIAINCEDGWDQKSASVAHARDSLRSHLLEQEGDCMYIQRPVRFATERQADFGE